MYKRQIYRVKRVCNRLRYMYATHQVEREGELEPVQVNPWRDLSEPAAAAAATVHMVQCSEGVFEN